MKILLLSTGGGIGGEETFTRNLALGLMKHGHNVRVACGGPLQKKDLENHRVPVANLQISSRIPAGIWRSARNLGRYIRKEGIDLVHCQAAGPVIMGGIIRWMHWTNGTRWYYHAHGLQKGTYRWIPVFLNMLDFTMAVSDYEMIQLVARGVKKEKIARVHNGIDPGIYSVSPEQREKQRREIRKELDLPAGALVYGFVGRLSPEKGCDLLIPAFQRVKDRHEETRLVVVGDGIMRASLEAAIADNRLGDSVILTGFRNDIPKLLCGLDVLLTPSYKETFSLTNLQAMSAGLPLIASDVCGNPEQVVPGYTGILFEPGNPGALAEAMIAMLRRDDRQVLGANGNHVVRTYLNSERMIKEILFYYEN
jgi:glycosyltransferase involved in cell wall biosynthesis